MFKILSTPNQVLLTKSKTVTKFDKKLLNEVSEMKKTLDATRDPVGVGLAAPQVGIQNRIFLAKPDDQGKTFVFVNPVIEQSSEEKGVLEKKNSNKVETHKPKKSKGRLLEGCLSVPNIWGNVLRSKLVTLSYQDENGKKYKKTFKGFMATIIQHEVDHLEGILFTKHVLAQKEQLYRSYKNKKGEDEFEEITI